MNIHELNYVLCIAKHQNMTKAARELYISQPTLSKHLGKLEPVSYTHLDVYKRQILSCENKKKRREEL